MFVATISIQPLEDFITGDLTPPRFEVCAGFELFKFVPDHEVRLLENLLGFDGIKYLGQYVEKNRALLTSKLFNELLFFVLSYRFTIFDLYMLLIIDF